MDKKREAEKGEYAPMQGSDEDRNSADVEDGEATLADVDDREACPEDVHIYCHCWKKSCGVRGNVERGTSHCH